LQESERNIQANLIKSLEKMFNEKIEQIKSENRATLAGIQNKLNQFGDKLKEIQESQDFLSSKYDDLAKEIETTTFQNTE